MVDEKLLELNSKMAYILNAVVKEKDKVPISSILNALKISKRTFYFEFKKVNEWLECNGAGRIEISGQQIVLVSESRERLLGRLQEVREYLFSVEERRAIELFYIALSCRPVTIDRMQSFFDVSKNTVFNDIKDLKEKMLRYDIKVRNSSPKGYYFAGEEISIRKLISREAQLLLNQVPRSVLQNLMQASMVSIYHSQVDYRFQVSEIIHDYENLLQTHLVENDIENIIVMILVACIRSGQKNELNMEVQEKEAIATTKEYQVVQLLVQKLSERRIRLPENETYYITVLFLGSKNFDFRSRVSEKNFIVRITESIIENFVQITGFEFRNKNLLYSRLYLHIKPMYYRLKYGVHITNPVAEKIKTMYPAIFEYTREAVQRAGGEIASLITEGEIAYLCIYMASYLKEYQGEKHNKKKILIVCGAGVSTSVLIRDQMQNFLGERFFYQLSPAGEIRENELNDYLMVISTVALDMEAKNIFYTGPILEEKTKKRMVQFLIQSDCFGNCRVTIRRVIQIMKEENIQFNESEMFLKLLSILPKKS